MRTAAAVLLVLAGLIHLLPLPGVLGAERLASLYGIAVDDPGLALLMRHRAVLFGLLGLLLVLAAFRRTLVVPALVAGAVSVVAFLVLAQMVGGYNAAIARVVLADWVVLGLLAGAAALWWLAGRRAAVDTGDAAAPGSHAAADGFAAMERSARCSCGQLRAHVKGAPLRVSVCHCLACQRRTGSAFGVQVRFRAEDVHIEGESREFVRVGDSGDTLRQRFCPQCGATVHYTMDGDPGLIAIPVGAFADPSFPPPRVEVYTERRHPWVEVHGELVRQA